MQNQQLPEELTQRQKDQIEEAIQDVRFDLWTGEEDKILRRIEVEFGFDLPKELQQDAQGVQRGTVELALEIADVNKDQAITAPSEARPLSELQSALGWSGRLGGSSGSGSSGGGSSGSGSSEAADRPAAARRRRLGRAAPTSAPAAAARASTASAPSAISTVWARPSGPRTSRSARRSSRNSGASRRLHCGSRRASRR